MTRLAPARVRDPACGSCGEDLEADGWGSWACPECVLSYPDLDSAPEFLEDRPGCGAPCALSPLGEWVGRDGTTYRDAGPGDPCPLPAGHLSRHVWERLVEVVAP